MNRFIVLSGLPASGKSTIGADIAKALGLPLLDKDDFLEALFEHLGSGDAEWRTRLSRDADAELRKQASQLQSAVLVSWWRHPCLPIESGTATDWLDTLPGNVIEVHCKCRPETAADRFFSRSRHAGHLDASKSYESELEKFRQFATYGALGLGRVIEVDTERAVDMDALLLQLHAPG